MKRIRLGKKIKIIIMISLIGLVCLLGVLCFKEMGAKKTVQEEKVLYQYTYANEAGYAVNLRPNQVYEIDKLPEGQIYLTEFIKDINTYFTSTFTGSDAASIKGEYEIVAQVAGYMTEEGMKKDIWSKEFVLVPERSFKGEGDSYKVEKTVSINYHSYDEFAKEVAEVAKVNLPMELRIIMKGNMSIKTPYETVDKPILTSIVMPLRSSYFTIATEGEGENQDSMKEVVAVDVLPNKKIIISYVVLIGVVMLGFIATLAFTRPLTWAEINHKKVKRILTTHRSRMVGVNEIIETGYKCIYRVQGIEDLIKVADELEKPLLYKYSKEILEMNKFYVIDKEIMYIYELHIETELKQVVRKQLGKDNKIGMGI